MATNNMFKIKPYGIYPKSKPARKPISKGVRSNVWTKYMGKKYQGTCYCCKIEPITVNNFEVGHNKSVYSGGSNNINNLRPVCRGCNRAMGTHSIEWWKKKYYGTKKTKPKPKKARRRRPKIAFGTLNFGKVNPFS